MKKFSAIPITAEKITGQSGCYCFLGENFTYTTTMNNKAKKGERLFFEDYKDEEGYFWLKEWLTDIREEVDWSKVKVDAKVIVTDAYGKKLKRHFAEYEDGRVYVWYAGATSFSKESNLPTEWLPEQVELVEE